VGTAGPAYPIRADSTGRPRSVRGLHPVVLLTSLRRVHAAAPRLPTVLNTNLVLPCLRGGRLPVGVSTVGVALRALRAEPGLVERVHARRGRVHVLTVDEPADVDYVAQLGVDAIISNYPGRVLRRLARH